MTRIEMITGSGNSVFSTVRLDERNCSAELWWNTRLEEWHWRIVWEDGCPWGTHMHTGIAPTRMKARADIVKTMIWIEDTWPRYEYFEGA
jgi:hypothetical protein